MSILPEYQDRGPLTIPSSLDLVRLAQKSVLITGGSGGLGRAYAKAFIQAGAYVTITDLDERSSKELLQELGGHAQFVKADVTKWDDQVRGFEAALQNSPQKSLDIVIANAGIVGQDDMFTLDDPAGPPVKPDLKMINVNLQGLLYTTKLAIHYFRRQPSTADRDRCLILKSSLAGYVDIPGSVQYNASKFGVRGTMRSLRRFLWKENIRVNLVAPWYVRTEMLSAAIQQYLDDKGVGFALVEDCCRAMLLIASNATINGRGVGVVSRQHAVEGLMDLELDDYKEGSLYANWQQIVLETSGILVE